MRIGFFTDSYKPYISGVVHSIETFSRELKKLGHEVTIFAPNYPTAAEEEKVFRFPSIPAVRHPGFYISIPLAPGLTRFLEENAPDIVHVHSPFIMGRVGARVAKSRHLPLVFTYHTLYDQYTHYVPFARQISRDLTRKFCIDFCNRCDLVITPTGVIGKQIKEMGVSAPIQSLPTGINQEEFAGADRDWLRRTYGIKEEEFVLLFVGRMSREKNVGFLIKVLKLIMGGYGLSAKLVLVGEGPETENLKTLVAEQGLVHQVIFTGKISRENLIRAYSGADLFVFASVTETQGLVIGEAKAAGVPVVAVDAFGVSEMVVNGEEGYLVPQDEQLFVSRVVTILKKPQLRKKMIRQVLVNAANLSAQDCAQKLAHFYQQLHERYAQQRTSSLG